MKVLLFSNLFPSEQEPTRGVFNKNRFLALSRQGGVETRVVVPVPWWQRALQKGGSVSTSSLFRGRVPRESTSGLEAEFPTYWSVPRLHAAHGRAMYLSLRPYMKRLRAEFPFDIILAAWAYPDGVAAAYFAQEFGCPLVTMTLGSDINESARYPALRRQIQWGLGQSGRVIAVSSALAERIKELGIPKEHISVQHNGVNGVQFALREKMQVRAELGLPLNTRLLCYVGNLKQEKGVDVLIEAMGHLSHAGTKDVTLVLVGSGPLEESLRARVATLGIENQVRFCGRQLHTEIPLWISAGDALCLPSRREGCPNVILEALASGRPVVASNVGGIPELLRSKTGVLVPSDDAPALARGISEVLEQVWDPCLLRQSVKCLSWDDVGSTYYNVLNRVLQ